MLEKGTHTASVVSITSVEVLILSKYDFYHLVDTRTQEMMQNYALKFYFDETSIRKSIQEQYEWDRYKGSLTDGLSSPRRSMPNSPRNGGGGGGGGGGASRPRRGSGGR